MLDISTSLRAELLAIAAVSLSYALGRLDERRRAKPKEDPLEMYFAAQCELKKIQHAVRCAHTIEEHEQLRERLRCLLSEHFELRELHPANGAFFGNWLRSVRGVAWDDDTVHRFRTDVQRLRAD